MDYAEAWRSLNSFLSMSAIILLFIDTIKRRNDLEHRALYLRFSLFGLLTGVFTSSLYYLVFPGRPFFHTALYTASSLWCIIGLWITRNDPN